jgi:hypothetical protein
MPVSFRRLATYSFTCNVGTFDRVVRLIVGIAMVLVGVAAFEAPGVRVAVGVTGVAIGLTGLVSRCGIYYLLGASTRSPPNASS